MTALGLAGLTVLGAYLVGAIPFGYLIARWRGVDIRKHGSGNIGATNVGRVLGPGYGILVFLLDFAKGALPVAAAIWLTFHAAPPVREFLQRQSLPVAAGMAAFLGHLFPVYLRFRGGKGVATGAGVVAVLLPQPMLVALIAWIVILCVTRYMSLASLGAAIAMCATRLAAPQPFTGSAAILTAFCLLAAGLVIVRHRGNLVRLLRGEELRLRVSAGMLALTRIVHLLALGLWFGTIVFFTFVVGLTLFDTFQGMARATADARPAWYPLAPLYDRAPDGTIFKHEDAVRREQGTRIAGAAVAPLFAWYFVIQAACGLVAVATALTWWSAAADALARPRTLVLLLAIASLIGGLLVERKVAAQRVVRDERVDAFLANAHPEEPVIAAAAASIQTFRVWHSVSLLFNFLTLGLVAAALAMAAWLPTAPTDWPTGDSLARAKAGEDRVAFHRSL